VVAGLLPDLGRGGGFVRERVGRVVELVGIPGPRDLAHQAGGDVLVVVRVALADVGPGQVDLGAEGLELQHLLGRHLVGHDEGHLIALGARHQGQAQTGVAGRRLDHRAAGLQQPLALGGLDHRQADAVLDRAARVLGFELEEELAGAGVQPLHRQQRRVADEVEHGGPGLQRGASSHESKWPAASGPECSGLAG